MSEDLDRFIDLYGIESVLDTLEKYYNGKLKESEAIKFPSEEWIKKESWKQANDLTDSEDGRIDAQQDISSGMLSAISKIKELNGLKE